MDLSKVKMVVTDMDGTLLNSKEKVSANFFNLHNQLKKYDIHFVVASGRPYQSIKKKINKIIDEITIVAENGAYAKQGYQELLLTNLSSNKIEQIAPLLRNRKGIYTVLCGKKQAYIESNDKKFINVLSEYYPKHKIVDDLTKVTDDIFLKIAVFHFDCSETYIYPIVKHLKDEMQVTVSGQSWLDLSESNANKGYAVNLLQKKWGITKEETMVFGDFNNDIKMLEEAYFSYAMGNAHPNIKKIARFHTKSNNEEGVEFILKQLLEAKILASKK